MSNDPWARLDPKPSNLRGNRVEGGHPLDAYWVRRSDGARGVAFYGVDFNGLDASAPCLKGVEVVPKQGSPSELGLFLQADEHREVFKLLCEDVVDASQRCESPRAATAAIYRRLEHWTEMLAVGHGRQLGDQAVRGLIGELLLLETLARLRGLQAALDAWVAPDDHPQDFSLPKGILEAKTRLAASRPLVSISSLEQLETSELPLALWVMELTPDPNGSTLNGLANDLMSLADAGGPALAGRMRLALLRRGYEHFDSYDALRYRVSGERAFAVASDFPRITRSSTDLRIRTATYQVDLTALGQFERDPTEILTSYFG